MLLGTGHAPGKIILFGEHAVVYGRPALAVPVDQVQATATVEAGGTGQGLSIWAADLGEEVRLLDAPDAHALASVVRLALAQLGLSEPDWRITIRSTIPVASGLGSGAAVSAAIVRAMADAVGQSVAPEVVSDLVYEVEKLHHGTPSGIDNTVIAFGRPVYFVRGRAPEPFPIGRTFLLAIADSGIPSPTKIAVGDVRRSWQAAPARLEGLFDRVAEIVERARRAIAQGMPGELGPLMDANQELLVEMGVSCPKLDSLVVAARSAGAGGAKLSGGGRGGNLIALVTEATASRVAAALRAGGAANVMITQLGAVTGQGECLPGRCQESG